MSRLGIELLSTFAMPPVEYVRLAAELGCGHVSSGLTGLPWDIEGHPAWSLRDDPELRRQMKAALRETGVKIGLGEGFIVRPGAEMHDMLADLDLMAELGAQRVNGASMEPDIARTRDQFALLAQYAHERGMSASIEYVHELPVGNLEAGLAVVRHVNQPHFQLLIDAMHHYRSGGTTAQLRALDPGVIGYVQLCDVPLQAPHGNYMQEAMFERMVPGAGELPLAEFVAALPATVPISLEIPMRAQAQAGVKPFERLKPAVAAAQALLA
jgi:sugar phosphate isomerase/epimerase